MCKKNVRFGSVDTRLIAWGDKTNGIACDRDFGNPLEKRPGDVYAF